jgi:predicted MPP superfamily phosphohydrolase
MEKTAKNNPGIIQSLSRRKFLLGGVACSGALFGDAWLRQPTALEISRIHLPSKKIPAGKELRIVHLSDLHLHKFTRYFRKVAEEANALKPDIILLTGDYVEEARNLSDVLEFLDLLKASTGIFAVQGNWEYWALIEGRNLQKKFRRSGVELLINQRADIIWNGIPVSLLGIDFPSSANSAQQLNNDADTDHINIALSHVPAFQHEILESKTDLILCGHTHGGQVRLPLMKPFHLPRHSGPYVSGLYHVGQTSVPLYVSRGIGTSILPIRFFCPPEISLIRLSGV